MQQRWIPDGMERVRHQQVTSWASQGGAVLHSFLVPLLSQRIGWRAVTRWYAVQSALMAVLWQMFAADTPARWRGPVKMDEEERELLESIGRGAGSGSKIAEAENDDIVAADDTLGPLIDKDLPPLSLGQLTSVHQIRGMLLMAIVQPLFPAQPFGALQTVYFARYT